MPPSSKLDTDDSPPIGSDPPRAGTRVGNGGGERVASAQDATKAARFIARIEEQRGALRKVARMYGSSVQDAEDIEQEILAHLWQAFDRYDPARPFGTWMYRVALNVAISSVRQTTRRSARVAHRDAEAFDPPDPKSESEQEPPQAALLRRFIDSLDELDRALLTLHLESNTYRDIAAILGITESNVGTKLSRLRQQLHNLAASESTP